MRKIVFLLAVLMVMGLAGCGIPQEQHDAAVSERDSAISERDSAMEQVNELNQQVDKLNSAVAEKEAEIEALTNELAELDALTEKYKDLSDSEILAQTEANNRQAEEDRIAAEALLAEEQAQKEAEAEAKRLAEEEEAKKGYETGITYSDLSRTPDDFKEKKVKFTGRVLQVIENTGEVNLRIATSGNYDNVILVYYDPKIVTSRVLEDDWITLFGVSKGLYTYESTGGGPITIPLISVDKIDQ